MLLVRFPLLVLHVLLIACCALGCANRIYESTRPDESRYRSSAPGSLKLEIRSGRVETGEAVVVVSRLERVRVEIESFNVRYERVIPYRPWNEIFELPFGAVYLPLGFVSALRDGDLLAASLESLNPAMNAEIWSGHRAIERDLERVPLSTRVEFEESKQPLSAFSLSVRIGSGRSLALKTNGRGRASFALADLLPESPGAIAREIVVAYRFDAETREEKLELPPELIRWLELRLAPAGSR